MKLCALRCLISGTSSFKSAVSKSNLWKITSFSKITSLQREQFLTMSYTINLSPFIVTKKGFMLFFVCFDHNWIIIILTLCNFVIFVTTDHIVNEPLMIQTNTTGEPEKAGTNQTMIATDQIITMTTTHRPITKVMLMDQQPITIQMRDDLVWPQPKALIDITMVITARRIMDLLLITKVGLVDGCITQNQVWIMKNVTQPEFNANNSNKILTTQWVRSISYPISTPVCPRCIWIALPSF